MLNYQPPAYCPAIAQPANLGQLGKVVTVPPFGLPPVTSGIILTVGGLVGGTVGTYLALRGAKVIGKKIPTFWQWYFGVGGIGATLAILGAIPLVMLGIMEIAGGVIIQKKLEELGRMVQEGTQAPR